MGGVSLAHTRLSVLRGKSILKRRTFFRSPVELKLRLGAKARTSVRANEIG